MYTLSPSNATRTRYGSSVEVPCRHLMMHSLRTRYSLRMSATWLSVVEHPRHISSVGSVTTFVPATSLSNTRLSGVPVCSDGVERVEYLQPMGVRHTKQGCKEKKIYLVRTVFLNTLFLYLL